MKRLNYAFLGAALVGVLALVALGSTVTGWVRAQDKPAKVNYVPITAGEYKLDTSHSTIGFSIRHNEITWVSGRFKEFAGTIRYDDKDVTKSSVEFTAKVESIDTGIAGRDTHLRSADFFEVAKYPEMAFKSSRIEGKGQNGYVLHGDFTLKGVTKPVAIPFTIAGAIMDGRGNTRFGVDGTTTINRRDYGINWGQALAAGGFNVGDEVRISLQLEVIKPAPKPPAATSGTQ